MGRSYGFRLSLAGLAAGVWNRAIGARSRSTGPRSVVGVAESVGAPHGREGFAGKAGRARVRSYRVCRARRLDWRWACIAPSDRWRSNLTGWLLGWARVGGVGA